MPLVGTLTTFVPATDILSAEVNGNFTALRAAFNSSAVLTDVAKAITVKHDMQAGLLISDGNLEVTDDVIAATVQAAGLLISGAGAAVIAQMLNADAPDDQDWRWQALDTGVLRLLEQVSGKTLISFAADGSSATIGALVVTDAASVGGALGVTGALDVDGGADVAGGLTLAGPGVAGVNAIGNTGAAKTIDWSTDNTATATVNQNTTLTFSGAVAGQWCSLRIQWGGAYTITWPSSVVWPGGSAPTFTRVSGRVDWVSFFFNGAKYEMPGFNLTP